MIRVATQTFKNGVGYVYEDTGAYLVHVLSSDYVMIARPDRGNDSKPTGQYHLQAMRRDEVRLLLRTPIPFLDPSLMGGRDAAITAARAASTQPTEELKHACTDTAICDGG